MSDPLYRLADDDGDSFPKFPGSTFSAPRNDADETINAKLRQAARLLANRLDSTPPGEREDWLQLHYPGGLNAARALMIHALDCQSVAPSLRLRKVCASMFNAVRKRRRREPGGDEKAP